MAVSMADITKLRKMTGAGMMDCKNALTEAEGDFDKAMEIIRKKGQAVAAKRSEREASEGCVLAKTTGDRAVIVALKCETDFVAQNADFVKLTQDILDLAVANKCATLDEVKALPMGNGTVQDAVTDRSGITGEKMELDGYMTVEGAYTFYSHVTIKFHFFTSDTATINYCILYSTVTHRQCFYFLQSLAFVSHSKIKNILSQLHVICILSHKVSFTLQSNDNSTVTGSLSQNATFSSFTF